MIMFLKRFLFLFFIVVFLFVLSLPKHWNLYYFDDFVHEKNLWNKFYFLCFMPLSHFIVFYLYLYFLFIIISFYSKN